VAALPTFSSLPRAFACPASSVLPTADEQSDHAAEGTVRHHYLRRVSDLMRGGMAIAAARELALSEAPSEARWFLALIPLESLRLKDVVAEVALAIDATDGAARVLGRAIDRRYDEAGRRPSEFAGSVDRLALIGAEGLYVGDYKGRTHTRKPEHDEQLLAGAYAGVRIYRRRWAELEIIRVVNGKPFPVKARVAAPDLERFGKKLQVLGQRIRQDRAAAAAGAIAPATTGDHCRYCPALRFCPAKGALVQAACGATLPALLQLAKERKPYLTEQNVAAVHARLAELEKLVRTMKGDIADFARQTPFRRPDGKVFGLTRSGRVAAHRARPREAAHA
jgi:hypothetical protein